MAHVLISAAHRSSGKTTVSVALAAALAARGLKVQCFKKGPDYIDPMWLARASGRPCYNLDYHTQGEGEISALFARHARRADVALIEGNKGLHDGVDPEGRDSTAALAKLLSAPVILVIDAAGITRGVAPLVLGCQMFDRAVAIGGVILNRVASARQESKLRAALERYTDVPVIGAIGRDRALVVEERHLGLITPAETPARDETIARWRSAVEVGVELARVQEIARRAQAPLAAELSAGAEGADVRIAVARDVAFGFYYPDDLEALARAGAELVFFDTLHDARLPPADGVFIGGGFPETQMPALSANAGLRAALRAAAHAGLPIYAECGGLMYLTRSIAWRGEVHEMVGFIPADTVMHATPQGRGLVVLEETEAAPWPAREGPARIPAHEFHYAALDGLDPATRFAYRVVRGRGIDGRHDGIVKANVLASFCHLRATARSGCWARRFVAFVRACKTARPASAWEPAQAASI
ncbi:MAG TPA: cobyrinate a,c-diamide synthase [Xanthobacteraceae bacterium]